MIKKELKQNFKSFIIWSSILAGMLIVVFLVYPSISKDKDMLNQMLEMFPSEMLKMFNMDLINLSTVSGWMLSEGYMFITLLGGCFSSILASNILVKEESDKTIEFLYSNPISKTKIITSKILGSLIYVFGINIVSFIISIIGFKLSNDLNMTNTLLMEIGSLSICLILYFITFFISVFFKSVKKSMGVAMAVSLGTYLIKIISALSEKLNVLKYFSPYEYFDTRYILINSAFELKFIIIGIFVSVICIFGSYYFYNKKEYYN